MIQKRLDKKYMCSIMELYIQACTFTPVSVKSPCEKMKYCAV